MLHPRRLFVVWLAAFSLGCSGRAVEPELSPRTKAMPNPWFLTQRSPDARPIPANARTRALEAARQAGGHGRLPGTLTFVGPDNIGGRVSALARDPLDPDHVWLGAASGGVFESVDGGTSWTPVFDDQVSLSIGAIASHPTDSDVVYVGTGEEGAGGWTYEGEGVYKTTDGGLTWNPLGLAEVRRIGKMAIDPVDPQRVFVAGGGGAFHKDVHRGVYRSVDGGASWQKVLYVADDTGAVDIAIDPSDPNRVLAAMWQRNRFDNHSYYGGPRSAIYRSLDGGDTWAPLSAGLPVTPDIGRIGLAIAPSAPQWIYAVIYDDTGAFLGIWRSTDGGDTWARVNQPVFLSNFGYYFGQIRVDPVDENVVYLLELRLLRSNDGGSTFSVVSGSAHPDQHALLIGPAPGELLLGGDGGFYRSEDGGLNWQHSQGLPITQFYGVCLDAQDPSRRFGGSQDNGTMRTGGEVSDWEITQPGDGMQCLIDPTDPDRVYTENQWGVLRRSIDGGTSWMTASNGIDPADRTNWRAPIVLDPAQPSTLYTGTYRVYRSLDHMQSWTAISVDLTNGPGEEHEHDPSVSGPGWRDAADHRAVPIIGTITALAVSPLDSDVVWVGTDDGNVWVTTAGGFGWNSVNPPGPAYWVTDIAPDPHDVDGAWLTVSGYRLDDTMPYVRRTSDLGSTWEDVSAGLPAVPLNAVVRDPSWAGRVFVGSDVGLHMSDDAGASWGMFAGMPYVVVQDLVLDDPSRTVLVGTYGRSMYTYDLDQLPPPDGDGDGVDNNLDCALADPQATSVPGTVSPLTLGRDATGAALVSWSDLAPLAGSGTRYDVASGTPGADAGPLACGIATPGVSDPQVPPPGEARYYLVRAMNACGDGGWGVDGDGGPRTIDVCSPPGRFGN